MLKRILLILIMLLALIAVAGLWLWNDYQGYLIKPLGLLEKQVFEVEKGTNYSKLLNKLESISNGINKPYMKLYGRQSGLAGKIKAGIYELDQNTTPTSFLATVTSGQSLSFQFTIIEGSTFQELKQRIGENPHLIDDISSLSVKEVKKKLDIAQHPEGMFLAETYSFDKNSLASSLLLRAHATLEKELTKAWEASRSHTLPYKTPYEALIMASIVEKETGKVEERPIISGVFVRRLNKKMRLQTDPTVIYGMGDNYKGNIRRSDLRKPTPYNTYVIPALPPTPIAMVGREAIVAALNPADGKALYFVAKGDGSHYFSATLKEHNNAVRKYQLNRKNNYRSSP